MAGVRQVLCIFSFVILIQWVSTDCVQMVPVPKVEKYRNHIGCFYPCTQCSYDVDVGMGRCVRFDKHIFQIHIVEEEGEKDGWKDCLTKCQENSRCNGALLQVETAAKMCYLLENVEDMELTYSDKDKFMAFKNPCK